METDQFHTYEGPRSCPYIEKTLLGLTWEEPLL